MFAFSYHQISCNFIFYERIKYNRNNISHNVVHNVMYSGMMYYMLACIMPYSVLYYIITESNIVKDNLMWYQIDVAILSLNGVQDISRHLI